MYADENIESVNFEQYTKTLIENIQLSFEKDNNDLLIQYDIEPVAFSLEKIILLGLIINETVSNVYKYAVLPNSQTILHISLKQLQINQYQLIIQDNGPGFDNTELRDKSLGLKLIQTMCMQLDANYTIENSAGVKHSITFNI